MIRWIKDPRIKFIWLWLTLLTVIPFFFNNCAKNITTALSSEDITTEQGRSVNETSLEDPNTDLSGEPNPTTPPPSNGTPPGVDPGDSGQGGVDNDDNDNGTPPPMTPTYSSGTPFLQLNADANFNLTLAAPRFNWNLETLGSTEMARVNSVELFGYSTNGAIRFQRHTQGAPNSLYLDDLPNMALIYRLKVRKQPGAVMPLLYSEPLSVGPQTSQRNLYPTVATGSSVNNNYPFMIDNVETAPLGGKIELLRVIVSLRKISGELHQAPTFLNPSSVNNEVFNFSLNISNPDSDILYHQIGLQYWFREEANGLTPQNTAVDRLPTITFWSAPARL